MTNETEVANLLPCPFCGSPARLAGGPMAQETYSVWCVGPLNHSMNYGFHKESAIAAWNTRADTPAAQAARIAELEAERGAVAARLERALITGSLNLARAEAAEAKLANTTLYIGNLSNGKHLRQQTPQEACQWVIDHSRATLEELKGGKDG